MTRPSHRSSPRTQTRLRTGVLCLLLTLFGGEVAAQEPEGGLVEPVMSPSVAITFLDVGQGDAIVIRGPDGRFVMIDAGRGSPLRHLIRLGVEELALVVASHPHADHIGGMVDVLTARPVGAYLDNGTPHTTRTYTELMEHVTRLDVQYLEATGRTISLGDLAIEVLPLPPESFGLNTRSLGLLLRYGAFTALLTGDSEREQLAYWVEIGALEDVTLFKAPHHGAANGYTIEALEVVRPDVVVISVGEGNTYGHPRPEALTAYASFADAVLRTDREGTVSIVGFADGSWEAVRGDGTSDLGADLLAASGPGARPEVLEPDASPLVVSVHANAEGDDHANLNGEYVTIENRGGRTEFIGLWRVCDLSSRCFRFPPDARVAAGRRVVVYSGYGTSDGISFFMNNDRAVWNNNGDEATLFDARGKQVVRHVYE